MSFWSKKWTVELLVSFPAGWMTAENQIDVARGDVDAVEGGGAVAGGFEIYRRVGGRAGRERARAPHLRARGHRGD